MKNGQSFSFFTNTIRKFSIALSDTTAGKRTVRVMRSQLNLQSVVWYGPGRDRGLATFSRSIRQHSVILSKRLGRYGEFCRGQVP